MMQAAGAAPAQQSGGQALLAALFAGAQAHEERGDDLETPTNAEAPAALQMLQAAAAPHVAAPLPPPPPPARPQACLLCQGLGGVATCGPLRPATFEGQPVVVHHLCAIWSPGCFQREGSSVYINLEEEARRAQKRTCATCGMLGASLTCSHPGCRAAYHLPCAEASPGVQLEQDTFEVFCPHHADAGMNSDEDYSLQAPRPRRLTGGSTGGKRQRAAGGSGGEGQRPRTDWQKKDDNTWLKVVPPWWCESRTVHFASKVFKELFRSGSSATLVDPAGAEWLCVVQSEARNDLRPQYTLRGAFAELWEAQGITAGDTLIFKRDPLSGHIDLSRIALGSGAAAAAKLEESANSELSDPSGLLEGHGGGRRGGGRGEASSEQTRGGGSGHPNRWMDLPDGWSVKTVYKSTLQHQQCPIAGWLFKKLYGRLPDESDAALMYDPDLQADYRFDVHFLTAANVHYLTGRTFSGWMRESGLQAGEQIRMRREGASVIIQRVPADRRVVVDAGMHRTASRSMSLGFGGLGATVAGAPAGHGMELSSPPPADALDALVAAAGYAGRHGTPAIQAAMAAAGLAQGPGLGGDAAGGLQALPLPKRKRLGEPGGGGEQLLLEQEKAALLARRQGAAFLEGWQPVAPHVLMLRSIVELLGAHQWSPEEQEDCLRFRAKFAWLDGCGREMVYEEVTRLAGDKAALLVFLRAVGQGILTPLPAPPAGAAAAAGTPAEAPAPGPVPASPFAEATSPGAAAAAAAVAAATMAAAEGGVPEAASTLEAPLVPKEEPAQLPVGGGLSLPGALENASSLNFGSSLSLDNLLGAMAAQAETPNPVGLLGPM